MKTTLRNILIIMVLTQVFACNTVPQVQPLDNLANRVFNIELLNNLFDNGESYYGFGMQDSVPYMLRIAYTGEYTKLTDFSQIIPEGVTTANIIGFQVTDEVVSNKFILSAVYSFVVGTTNNIGIVVVQINTDGSIEKKANFSFVRETDLLPEYLGVNTNGNTLQAIFFARQKQGPSIFTTYNFSLETFAYLNTTSQPNKLANNGGSAYMFPNGNYVFISATTPGSTDNTIVFMVLNPQNEIINSFNISIQIQDFSLIAQTSTGILLYGQNFQTQEQNILFFDNQGKQKWNIAVNEANSTFIPYQLKMTDSNFILLGTKASTIDQHDNSLYAYEKADLSWVSIPLNGSTYTQKTISTQNPTVALGMHLRTDGNWDVISATKVFKSLNTYSVHKINPDGFIIY